MTVQPGGDLTLPLIEERAHLEKHAVETGRVRVSTRIEEREALIDTDLRKEIVSIDRIILGTPVETIPAIRQEGDVLIYPVVEEVLVVEKRLILKEELRITKRHTTERVEETVTLQSMQAVVERTKPDPTDT